MTNSNIVKTLSLLLLFSSSPMEVYGEDLGLSKEQIIENAWKSMFGTLNNNDIGTISIEIHRGENPPNQVLIKRPNLFRNLFEDSVLVFDGKRVVEISRNEIAAGKLTKTKLLESNHWQHFEVDIALIFPAFFDYASKLQGLRKIESKLAYELFVALPQGGTINYFVDVKNFKLVKIIARWEGNPAHRDFKVMIDRYVAYDDFEFPVGYSYTSRKGKDVQVKYKGVRINIPIEDALFDVTSILNDSKH